MHKPIITIIALAYLPLAAQSSGPLPSWNDTVPKKAIIAFVEKVTTAGSPDYVVPAERIATFDNDGCLWSEQPMYVQALFVFDSSKRMAPQHPEWKEEEPFASVLKGDLKTALAGGEKALVGMIIHHTDAEREAAYDRESHIGKLDKCLDDAPAKGWTVVNMKNDWKTIFP